MLENALFWSAIIIYEVIAVEQIIVINCLKRKIKLWKIIASLLLITLLITLIMVFVLSKGENFGDGGGRNLFLGILYIIPGFLCFKGSKTQKFIVNFAAYTYGLGIFIISIRIGYLFERKFLYLAVFLSQTILNIALLPFIVKQAKLKFIPMLTGLTKKIKSSVIQSCMVSFALIILINSAITRGTKDSHKVAVVIFLCYLIFLIYKIMIDYSDAAKENDYLLNIAFKSSVTGLHNGIKFNKDINGLVREKENFLVVYLDLDTFKNINDTFGHLKGDEYLFEFGQVLKNLEDEKMKCYHLSGDEFCLLTTKSYENTIKILESLKIEKLSDMNFLGVSYGIANYSKDNDSIKDIISRADSKMYENKKFKYKNR